MTTTGSSTQIVLAALSEVNAQRSVSEQVAADLEAPLFGMNGRLDSLALVTLLLEIEDRVRQKHGMAISLADERAMSEARSPFRTLGVLADYVEKRIAEARGP
jgi:acyl carrier protein